VGGEKVFAGDVDDINGGCGRGARKSSSGGVTTMTTSRPFGMVVKKKTEGVS